MIAVRLERGVENSRFKRRNLVCSGSKHDPK